MSKFVNKSHYEIKSNNRMDKNFTEKKLFSVETLVNTALQYGNNERVF